MEESKKIELASSIVAFVRTEESLRIEYNAIDAITKEEKKKTSNKRKENREHTEKAFKDIGNALEAAEIATSLLPKRTKKGDNARKIAQRQRDWLKDRLGKAYPDYDFETSDTMTIIASFEGDEVLREAKNLFASLERINSLVGEEEKVTVKLIESAIRKEVAGQLVDNTNEGDSLISDAILMRQLVTRGKTLTQVIEIVECTLEDIPADIVDLAERIALAA